jgi:nitrate/TMAO reductase-like tetraheme cytochrome c subunit
MAQHGWRCARCRSSRRLEIHHRKYRSHGGNTPGREPGTVCRDCHKIIHNQERSK